MAADPHHEPEPDTASVAREITTAGSAPDATDGVALDLDWIGLASIVTAMAGEIRAAGTPEVIVGVLRGGAVPAALLSHQLDVRAVRCVSAELTLAEGPNAAKAPTPTVHAGEALRGLAGRDVLLVDDVAGSGATVESVTAVLRSAGCARVRRAVCVVNIDNWRRRVTGDTAHEFFDHVGTVCCGWVRFPWEKR